MIHCKTWRTSETRGRPLKSDTTFDFGKVSLNEWLRAATFDRGVGIALFTLQVTHHIGPKVDDERDAVGTVFEQGGSISRQPIGTYSTRSLAPQRGRVIVTSLMVKSKRSNLAQGSVKGENCSGLRKLFTEPSAWRVAH